MNNNLWIIISFFAMFCVSLRVIALGKISKFNYNQDVMLCFLYFIIAIMSFIYSIYLYYTLPYDKFNIIKNMNKNEFITIIIYAFFSILTTKSIMYAFSISPNISYSHSIINLNILITIVASIILFKQNINFNALIGMILSLIGIIILICNGNN